MQPNADFLRDSEDFKTIINAQYNAPIDRKKYQELQKRLIGHVESFQHAQHIAAPPQQHTPQHQNMQWLQKLQQDEKELIKTYQELNHHITEKQILFNEYNQHLEKIAHDMVDYKNQKSHIKQYLLQLYSQIETVDKQIHTIKMYIDMINTGHTIQHMLTPQASTAVAHLTGEPNVRFTPALEHTFSPQELILRPNTATTSEASLLRSQATEHQHETSPRRSNLRALPGRSNTSFNLGLEHFRDAHVALDTATLR